MIPIILFVLFSFGLFSLGMAGVAATRHFLLMILSVEISLVAASLLTVTLFYYGFSGNVMLLLFTIWTLAATEAIALVSFYRYLARFETTLDVTKLSRIKD